MIESPLIQEIVAEAEARGEARAKAATILTFLRARLGPIPQDLSTALQSIQDLQRLDQLAENAARCTDLNAFRSQMEA